MKKIMHYRYRVKLHLSNLTEISYRYTLYKQLSASIMYLDESYFYCTVFYNYQKLEAKNLNLICLYCEKISNTLICITVRLSAFNMFDS